MKVRSSTVPESIDLFEAMYTQRAIRRFKSDPVPDETISKLIDAAIRAPSGANQQNWKFIIIRDPAIKHPIGEYYRRAWEAAYDGPTSPSPQPATTQVDRQPSELSRLPSSHSSSGWTTPSPQSSVWQKWQPS